MNQVRKTSTLFVLLIIILLLLQLQKSQCIDERYLGCEPASCGDGKNVSFPFHIMDRQPDYCGYPGFGVHCSSTTTNHSIIELSDNEFYAIHEFFYHNQSIKVSNLALSNLTDTNTCLPPIENLTLNLDHSKFDFGPDKAELLLFYGCNKSARGPKELLNYQTCFANETGSSSGYVLFGTDPNSPLATRVCENKSQAPISANEYKETEIGEKRYLEALNSGFLLKWKASNCSTCSDSGGRCGTSHQYQFHCYCPDRPHLKCCHHKSDKRKVVILAIVIPGAVLITLLAALLIYLHRHRKQKEGSSNFLLGGIFSGRSKSDLEKSAISYGLPVFTYGELEEATNNFDSSKELGDGGFGTVYYGKLRDGREVAVKRLYENTYKRVEQFLNEVEILTRLHHPNLVTLYGCTSRHSRELLLVYEFIPNGTVADHLHGNRAKDGSLTWPIRMNIAIETACALAYLHASDIIHRDVKTTNILLDNNFSVKVADFGLSRLFPTDVSHISTAPQGTPGYVDPEYHQCYQLTAKSDVYSFGVVLIELISSMPAVDISRHRHEINLANLAINRIRNSAVDELIDPLLGFESDSNVRRMTTSVAELAFQCLQHETDMRPTMDEVLKTLERISNDEHAEEESVASGVLKDVQPPASPECDEVVLLKDTRPPLSPNSVTDKWLSAASSLF